MKEFLKNSNTSTRGWIVIAGSGFIFLIALVLASDDWSSKRGLIGNIGWATIELFGCYIQLRIITVLCMIGAAIGALMVFVGKSSDN